MLRIGSKKDGIQYKKRICAYAIIERIKDKKIAIATDKSDIYFLLGGGREKDELIEETLKREIIEETIYIAKFDKKILAPIEKDHRILWVSPLEYKDKLYHEYQRYILNKYILKEEK